MATNDLNNIFQDEQSREEEMSDQGQEQPTREQESGNTETMNAQQNAQVNETQQRTESGQSEDIDLTVESDPNPPPESATERAQQEVQTQQQTQQRTQDDDPLTNVFGEETQQQATTTQQQQEQELPTISQADESQLQDRDTGEAGWLTKGARRVLPDPVEDFIGIGQDKPFTEMSPGEQLEAMEDPRQNYYRKKRREDMIQETVANAEVPKNYTEPSGFFGQAKEGYKMGMESLFQRAPASTVEMIGNMTNANNLEEWGAKMADKQLQDVLQNPQWAAPKDLQQASIQEKLTDPRFYGRIAGGLIPSVLGAFSGAAAGGLAGFAAGGPAGAATGATIGGGGAIFTQEAGATYQELVDQGYSPEQASEVAAPYGAIASLLEGVNFIRAGDAVLRGAGLRAAKETYKRAAKQGIKDTLVKGSKEFGKTTGIEIATETSQNLVHNIGARFLDSDQALFENMVESAAGGTLGGMGFGTVQVGGNALADIRQSAPNDYAQYAREQAKPDQDSDADVEAQTKEGGIENIFGKEEDVDVDNLENESAKVRDKYNEKKERVNELSGQLQEAETEAETQQIKNELQREREDLSALTAWLQSYGQTVGTTQVAEDSNGNEIINIQAVPFSDGTYGYSVQAEAGDQSFNTVTRTSQDNVQESEDAAINRGAEEVYQWANDRLNDPDTDVGKMHMLQEARDKAAAIMGRDNVDVELTDISEQEQTIDVVTDNLVTAEEAVQRSTLDVDERWTKVNQYFQRAIKRRLDRDIENIKMRLRGEELSSEMRQKLKQRQKRAENKLNEIKERITEENVQFQDELGELILQAGVRAGVEGVEYNPDAEITEQTQESQDFVQDVLQEIYNDAASDNPSTVQEVINEVIEDYGGEAQKNIVEQEADQAEEGESRFSESMQSKREKFPRLAEMQDNAINMIENGNLFGALEIKKDIAFNAMWDDGTATPVIQDLERRIQEAQENGDLLEPVASDEKIGDPSINLIERLEGRRGTISRQFIEDEATRQGVKEGEKEVIIETLDEMPEGSSVDIENFINRLQDNLVKLTVEARQKNEAESALGANVQWGQVTIPEFQQNRQHYGEKVYDGFVENTAAGRHFTISWAGGYFAHSRQEIHSDETIKNIIEIQSDLFQKEIGMAITTTISTQDNLGELDFKPVKVRENEDRFVIDYEVRDNTGTTVTTGRDITFDFAQQGLTDDNANRAGQRFSEAQLIEAKQNLKEGLEKAQDYKNIWHQRVINEEIKRAAEGGFETLRFPTGRTQVLIEQQGEQTEWASDPAGGNYAIDHDWLKDKGVGTVIYRGDNAWVVTDILSEPEFRAITKASIVSEMRDFGMDVGDPNSPNDVREVPNTDVKEAMQNEQFIEFIQEGFLDQQEEAFTTRTEVQETDPIFRFQENEVLDYLETVKGDQVEQVTGEFGYDWYEIPITEVDQQTPVGAFGSIEAARNQLQEQARRGEEGSVAEQEQLENMTTSQLEDLLQERFSQEENYEEALTNILVEIDIAEAGDRIFTEDGEVIEQESTFPDWIPDDVRNRRYIEKALETVAPDSITYPSRANANRQREFVDALYDQLDEALGTDTSLLRGNILNNYGERTETSTSPEQVSRGDEGGETTISELAEEFAEPTERERRQQQQITEEERLSEQQMQQVRDFVDRYITETQAEVDEIVEMRQFGSTVRGEETEESDVDIIFQYEGDIREDSFFNGINQQVQEEGFEINGREVDFTPIKPETSGQIDEFMQEMRRVEEELSEDQMAEELTEEEEQMAEAMNSSSGGVYASKGIFREDTAIKLGNMDKVNPFELPEMIDLVRELTGEAPQIFESDERTQGLFKSDDGTVKIKASLFEKQNLEQATKTLAHEIGHLVDWLPDETMKRGNLLGRLFSLKEFMKNTYNHEGESITTQQRKDLRNQATREVLQENGYTLSDWINKRDQIPDETQESIKDQISERYDSLVEAAKEDGNFIADKDIRQELLSVSKFWRPWDPETSSESYNQYRRSGEELYADAISMLLNDPQTLEEMAPTFYENFFEALDKKPDMREAYFDLQALIRGDRQAVISKRRGDIQQMFERADYKAQELEKRRREEMRERRYNIMFRLKKDLIDNNQAVINKVNEVKQDPNRTLNPDDNPRHYLDEAEYLGGLIKAKMKKHFEPIIDTLDENNIGWHDFGEYLFEKRIVDGDRSDVANPRGITPEAAQELIDNLEKQLGEEKMEIVRQQAERFRTGLRDVTEEAYEQGLYSDELYQNMIDNPEYATFQVVEHLDENVTSEVHRSLGTTKDITNPANATLMKLIATMRATERQKVKLKTFDFLKEHFPDEIEQAETEFTGRTQEPVEPNAPDKELVKYKDKGTWRGVYVDPYIADALKYNSLGQTNIAIDALKIANRKVLRPLFISLNLGFQTYNLMRDFFRFWKNVPDATFLSSIKRYREAATEAKVRAFGLPDNPTQEEVEAAEMIRNLEEAQVLSTTFNDIISGQSVLDNQIEQIMQDTGVRQFNEETGFSWLENFPRINNAAQKALSPVKKTFNWIRNVGDMFETLPKVAGVYELKDGGIDSLSMEDKNFIRRKIGSPDFLAGGSAKPTMNEVFLFSNAIIQGMRADLEIMTDPKTRSGYWWKTAKMNIAPKILLFAGLAGLFGDDVKDILEGVSEYDKTNYTPIPLGLTETGKSVYLRMPQDETGRIVGGLFWKAITAGGNNKDFLEDAASIASYTGGQIPSVSPILGTGQATLQFLSGKNPYDMFRQRNVISERAFEAGGTRAAKSFAGWAFQQLGGGTIYSFYNEPTDPEKKSTLEKVINAPLAGTVLGRWIRVSDYGKTEDFMELGDVVREKQARQNLKEDELMRDAVKRAVNAESAGERIQIRDKMIRDVLQTMEDPADKSRAVSQLMGEFRESLKRAGAKPRVDALTYAQSNEEKARILQEVRKDMDAQQFDQFVGEMLGYKIISSDVLRELERLNVDN